MSRVETTTNFRDNNGTDLGKKLITKDYLISVYPGIGDKIGIPPELWTWGWGFRGVLGNGATSGNISTPVTTSSGGATWKQVSCGLSHVAAIKTDGTLWTWGYAAYGRLGGNSTVGIRLVPATTFAGGTNWKQVSAGALHTAAIKTDGTLWVWGYAYDGALGNGSLTNALTPVTTFSGGTNWNQVSCNGSAHTSAIKTDGTLWVWGSGESFRLGNGQSTRRITPITTFAGGNNWKQVSCGSNYTAAVKNDGTLWSWGNVGFGQLAINVTGGTRSTPVTTSTGGTNWKQVSCGDQSTAAIKTDGTLWTWGRAGNYGQLGNGVTSNIGINTPITTFAGGTNWKQVTNNKGTMLAIKTDGTLWTWGSGGNGQLGNAQTTNASTPVTVFGGGNDWKQVNVGGSFTAAIKSVDFSPF
jgi:alpha-tubulin suppressor-like RCC1 family protein